MSARPLLPLLLVLCSSACSYDEPTVPYDELYPNVGGTDAAVHADVAAADRQDARQPLGEAAVPKSWFPFTIDGLDATQSPTDLSFLNAAPAGASGFIHAKDGHFADGAGNRIRFFGVALVAGSCFPEKDQAPLLAAHLRKLGVNAVRFHMMDVEAPVGLFLPGQVQLDPEPLDKLDFLVFKLKENGIYSDLNLHVGRDYFQLDDAAAAGVPLGKVADRFYPRYIQLQKDYARDLLTHKNPYTGLRYVEEPAILSVELNNENTLFPFWGGGPLRLSEPYRAELTRQWRSWLSARYATTAALEQAWRVGVDPIGAELLPSPADAGTTVGWDALHENGADGSVTVVSDPTPVLRWVSTATGTESWSLELNQAGLPIADGKAYTLTFRGRLSPGATGTALSIGANVRVCQDDWHSIGLAETVELGTDWKTFTHAFTARKTIPDRGCISFDLRNQVASVDFADISLRIGADFALPSGETLEFGNLSLPPESFGLGGEVEDFAQFLADTESATVADLSSYIRTTLGLSSMLIDTQADYGGHYGLLRAAAQGDYVDMHTYWGHPWFPAIQWDAANWFIDNVSQIPARDGGALATLAPYRLATAPFSVSEYNMAAPNDAGVETLPLYAAIASYQDWDAIYTFDYLDYSPAYDSNVILGFFALAGNAGRLAFAPAAALLFRKGLVAPGAVPVTLTVSKKQPQRSWDSDALASLWSSAGASPAALARRRLQVSLVDGTAAASVSETLAYGPSGPSDTNELNWASDAASPIFTVNAKSVRLAVGEISAQRVTLGDVIVEVGELPLRFAAVELVAMDEKAISDSSRVLLTIGARFENTGMGWNDDRTSVGDQWGAAPTIAERVPADITVPGTGWRAWSLDAKGVEQTEVALTTGAAGTVLSTRTAAQSMWYVLKR